MSVLKTVAIVVGVVVAARVAANLIYIASEKAKARNAEPITPYNRGTYKDGEFMFQQANDIHRQQQAHRPFHH